MHADLESLARADLADTSHGSHEVREGTDRHPGRQHSRQK